MKLYATTTSERASKGQGGNRQVITSFTFKNSLGETEYVADIIFTAKEQGGYTLEYFDTEEEGTPSLLKEKGNNQKGERMSIGMGRTIPKS
jgi:hypothetical protein